MDSGKLRNSGGNRAWIGVDVGGTKTAVVLSLDLPHVVERFEFPTLPEQGPDHAIHKIKESIRRLIDQWGVPLREFEGIGISCGGPLDSVAGLIQAPPNLHTWIDVPIVSILEAEFSIPCRLENDANAGAAAEHRFGAGKGANHVIFLTMGTGLGAGIIVDGRLLRGASGQAGEIGHVRLTASGPVGYNKPGSAEGWASGAGMAQVAAEEIAAAARNGQETMLANILNIQGAVTAKDVAAAARQGDAIAKRIIESTGSRLGEAIAVLVDLFNPEKVIVGGLAMRFGDKLLAPARETIMREALPASAAICKVAPAALGERIGDVAALCVAMGL